VLLGENNIFFIILISSMTSHSLIFDAFLSSGQKPRRSYIASQHWGRDFSLTISPHQVWGTADGQNTKVCRLTCILEQLDPNIKDS